MNIALIRYKYHNSELTTIIVTEFMSPKLLVQCHLLSQNLNKYYTDVPPRLRQQHEATILFKKFLVSFLKFRFKKL